MSVRHRVLWWLLLQIMECIFAKLPQWQWRQLSQVCFSFIFTQLYSTTILSSIHICCLRTNEYQQYNSDTSIKSVALNPPTKEPIVKATCEFIYRYFFPISKITFHTLANLSIKSLKRFSLLSKRFFIQRRRWWIDVIFATLHGISMQNVFCIYILFVGQINVFLSTTQHFNLDAFTFCLIICFLPTDLKTVHLGLSNWKVHSVAEVFFCGDGRYILFLTIRNQVDVCKWRSEVFGEFQTFLKSNPKNSNFIFGKVETRESHKEWEENQILSRIEVRNNKLNKRTITLSFEHLIPFNSFSTFCYFIFDLFCLFVISFARNSHMWLSTIRNMCSNKKRRKQVERIDQKTKSRTQVSSFLYTILYILVVWEIAQRRVSPSHEFAFSRKEKFNFTLLHRLPIVYFSLYFYSTLFFVSNVYYEFPFHRLIWFSSEASRNKKETEKNSLIESHKLNQKFFLFYFQLSRFFGPKKYIQK